MRAIIIATGHAPEIESMNEPRPVPLFPLIDRPFIQHTIEYLVDQGATEFDFLLSHLPEKFEELLGDGSRWGSQFRYHLARDAAHPYRLLKSLETEGVVLAHADRLPQVRLDQTEPACESGPTIYVTPHNSGAESGWIGWAWLPASLIVNCKHRSRTDARLPKTATGDR